MFSGALNRQYIPAGEVVTVACWEKNFFMQKLGPFLHFWDASNCKMLYTF